MAAVLKLDFGGEQAPEEALKPLAISPETLSILLDGIGLSTLADWRATWKNGREGEGPRFFKVGRLVRYSVAAVEEWLTDLENAS
ncbi:helix-turn-helix transcriptional regulator [Gulosibacter molinativorax]|uniref:helix-turn-helix transcriptional regulator n=1 Tax=Gulosibacter molinativorax TaxID=256821 RepID=UPI000420DB19|nr:hypothetical protein [Gulosibacter molinativorax]QUY63298.1 Hypotetical protein [Gulosibacter molinativorax]